MLTAPAGRMARALVAELAAGMGGHAGVDSPPGGPTTFTLVLDGSCQRPVARS
jgi:signal transduction histidine kinase